jgi:3-oxoacyl-[acyl-carrier-protein] synthase III
MAKPPRPWPPRLPARRSRRRDRRARRSTSSSWRPRRRTRPSRPRRPRCRRRSACNGCIAFDVAAVCSGFLYAVGVADAMIRARAASTALVIGAETFSRILDWEDRTTCVLFGDGAGAIVLEGRKKATTSERGILATKLHADGAHNPAALCRWRPFDHRHGRASAHEGPEVFKHAVVPTSPERAGRSA